MRFCSNCTKEIDADSRVIGKGMPQPGNVSICIYCGQLCIFQEDLSLRVMSTEELGAVRIEAPEVFLKIMQAVAYIKARVKQN